MQKLLLALCLVLGVAPSPLFARGASPYLPLQLEPELERQIEQVLILAGVPHLVRPIPAAVVIDALPRACRIDRALCESVRGFLERYTRELSVTHATLEGAVASGADRAVPNRHGLGSASAWEASARVQWQPFDHAIATLGALAYDGDVTPTGTLLSLGWSVAQLDIGWRDHWLSPFTDSAMLLSTEAATMPSITLSNYEPLTPLGIRFELFAARVSKADGIVDGSELTSGHPRIAGAHLSIEPVPGWSIGASRVMQYGGGSRDSSFKDFLKAFFDPAQNDNVLPGGATTEQFGNQVASITSRFVFPGPVPFAAYVEYAGEDTLSRENYLLGNAALSLGIDFPRLFEQFDLTYEVSDWQNAWYVHPLYAEGFANDGRVLGHWGGDRRQLGDAVGAQTHMVRLGWRPRFGGAFDFRYRTIENESYSSVSYDRGHDFALRYARPWRELSVGGEVFAGRDVDGESFSRVLAFVRYAPNAPSPPGLREVEADAVAERPRGAEIFMDAGANFSRVEIDLDRNLPTRTTSWAPALHVGLGARRAITERQDLGVRLELEQIDDDWLLGVRLVDYRFRLGRHLALSVFGGAARWALATPAYGVYVGAGAQWRDIVPDWDVSLDARYSPNIARDDLVPQDPAGGRASSYREVVGLALYLSRGF